MKKKIIIVCLGLILTLAVVVACSKANNTGAAELTEDVKLMIGTMKLEGSANVVTSDQASALLPLWQAYQSLASSTTAAQAEKDALLKQIKGVMTAGQLKAIDDMKLKASDIQMQFQQRGFNPTFEGTRGIKTPSSNLQMPSGGNPGGSPPGGFVQNFSGAPPNEGGGFTIMGGPEGGGMMVNGAMVTPDASQKATLEASRNNLTSSPFMFNLIIRYLEGIITPNK